MFVLYWFIWSAAIISSLRCAEQLRSQHPIRREAESARSPSWAPVACTKRDLERSGVFAPDYR
jgi:hypothetical protein